MTPSFASNIKKIWPSYLIAVSPEIISAKPAITCSKLTIETLQQDVKYVQS